MKNKGKVRGAVVWGYGGGLIKIVTQFIAQAILVRLLGPSEYGVFAVGIMVVSLSIFFAESGTGAALIQRQSVSDELIEFAFSVQLLLGLVIALIVCFSASFVSSFYNEPRAEPVIQALSLVIFVTALSSISSSLLKRQLDFKSLQIGQIGGYVVGYLLVGIPAALNGAGVWSLVFAWIAQATVSTVYWYLKTRHPCKINFALPEGAEILRFGGATIVSNLATWAGGYVDKIVVGRMFSSGTLGLYTIPFTFLGTVAAQILGTLQPVLFAATSQTTKDKKELRRAYLDLLEGVSLLLLPVFATVAMIPEVVLAGIYGPLWAAAAEIMRAASLSMAAYVLSAIGTPILWALARVRSEAKAQIVATLVIIVAAVPLSRHSAEAVAWGVAFTSLGRMLWVIALVSKAIELHWSQCLRALVPAFVTSAVCVLVAELLVHSTSAHHLHDIFLLVAIVFCCTCTLFAVTLAMRGRLLSPELDERIDSIIEKLRRW